MGSLRSWGGFLPLHTPPWETKTLSLKISFSRIKSLISQFSAYLTSQTSTFQFWEIFDIFPVDLTPTGDFFLRKCVLTQWKHDKQQCAAKALLKAQAASQQTLGRARKSSKQEGGSQYFMSRKTFSTSLLFSWRWRSAVATFQAPMVDIFINDLAETANGT